MVCLCFLDMFLDLRLTFMLALWVVSGMFGVPDEGEPIHDKKFYELASADIVVVRQEAWNLMLDMRVIRGEEPFTSPIPSVSLDQEALTEKLVLTIPRSRFQTSPKRCR